MSQNTDDGTLAVALLLGLICLTTAILVALSQGGC